jgi:hypothetical protein
LLAGSASSMPKKAASNVPTTDIASVSSVAGASFARKRASSAGVPSSATNFVMRAVAPAEKNCAHCRSSETKLAITSAIIATTNQHALQRASKIGGGSR